jgi:hypothetical protein
MRTSRSIASRSSLRGLVTAAALLVALLVAPGVAEAKRRVVVLPFEGPKGDRFQADVIELIAKSSTIVDEERWQNTAEDLSATAQTGKNIAKVARKLDIDGVVMGSVEKRRDRYIVRVKVREGDTGDFVGNPIEVVSNEAKLDARAARDLKEELLDTLDALGSSDSGDDDRDDDRDDDSDDDSDRDVAPKPKPKPKPEPKPEPKPKPKPEPKPERDDDRDDDDDRDRDDDDDRDRDDDDRDRDDDDDDRDRDRDDDDRVGFRDDDDDRDRDRDDCDPEDDDCGDDLDDGPTDAPAMAPATRAVELVGGMNVTARRLIYTRDVDLDAPPTPYLGTPVASAMIDATVYPLAFSGKPSLVRNLLGVRLLLDRSLMLKNQLTIGNDVTTLSGKQQHLAIGAALRFGIGKAAVIGRLEYHRFTYELGKTDMQVDIPDVGYRYEEFGVSARLPVGDRAVAGFDGGLMLLNTAGEIQHLDWYGGGTALGYNAQASIEARLVKKLTLRVALHVASIGIDFAGVGDLATGRDNDMQQDVHSVQDTYFGGNAGLGWMF